MSRKIDLNKFKDVVGQLKSAQKQFQSLVNKETLKEAKKYAESSGKELKTWIQNADMKKVKALIERETKEIHKLQKKIPGELAKFSRYVDSQKGELEKILKSVHALEAKDYLEAQLAKTAFGKKVGFKKKPKKKHEKTVTVKSQHVTPTEAAEMTAQQENQAQATHDHE